MDTNCRIVLRLKISVIFQNWIFNNKINLIRKAASEKVGTVNKFAAKLLIHIFMKKLSKIKLQEAVVLENQEMKMIVGGSGVTTLCGSNPDGSCATSTCEVNGRSGTCTVRGGVCGCLVS